MTGDLLVAICLAAIASGTSILLPALNKARDKVADYQSEKYGAGIVLPDLAYLRDARMTEVKEVKDVELERSGWVKRVTLVVELTPENVQKLFPNKDFSGTAGEDATGAQEQISSPSMATTAPQPGRVPVCVGQFGSRLVATSLAPLKIMPRAASTDSKLNVRPSPTTT